MSTIAAAPQRAGLLPAASAVRRLTPVRLATHLQPAPPQRPRRHQRQQQRSTRRLPVTARSGGGGGPGRQQPAQQPDLTKLLQQWGLPLAGLLAGALMIKPLLLGLVFVERVSVTLVGLGGILAIAAGVLALAWLAVPFLTSVFGLSAVVGGGLTAGVLATAAAGVLHIPSLVPLVVVGGALLLLGSKLQQAFATVTGGGRDPDATIDVEADTVDEWREEVSKEQRERQADLHRFDELLRSRDGSR